MVVRRWQVAVLSALSVLALACEGEAGGGTPGEDPPPNEDLPASMAALGDSITAGYGTCATLVACVRNSWATGFDPDVDSHYLRIRAANPDITDQAHNFAKAGARAADLAGQADAAVRTGAAYVTIMIGANDACRANPGAMTPVADFRAQVDAALNTIKDGLPEAEVLVASVPDVYRLWELGHTDERAVAAWNRGICQSMLGDPTSLADQDQDRRREVDGRIEDYNRELRRACREFGDRCRDDEGAVHRVRFTLDLVNHLDFFHPNVAGQAAIAEKTYMFSR
ncbi:lysophospholipase L1-like esterase [Catenuloplanes nepalensis]|uniref:Lysophospholipase L1-like esterase n=1 Tax=Catenuloplanes nepalensis TaxID=587533 RepID=A0ABT9MYK1_9ACTN|nr:SGNH/GDSL hydrolase family protein [Catenuloplanes nepalensis]MDP9796502.1 lysophospholipase L1-like esterase [Catenuloplanes nepalensis]